MRKHKLQQQVQSAHKARNMKYFLERLARKVNKHFHNRLYARNQENLADKYHKLTHIFHSRKDSDVINKYMSFLGKIWYDYHIAVTLQTEREYLP